MENTYDSIPYPNFRISDFITQKGKDFVRPQIQSTHSLFNRGLNDSIERTINILNNDKDRIQFTTFLINHINKLVAEHIPVCKETNCQVVPASQSVLHFLYGQLEKAGLDIDVDSFTAEQTYKNIYILDEVIKKLKLYNANEQHSESEVQRIEDMIIEVESLKGLQVLGKNKWFILVGAFMLNYVSTVLLDESIKAYIITAILSLGDIPQYLLK